MELQKLWVTLALKANEFKEGLDGAAKKAQGFAGQVGGVLGGISKAAGVAFLGVGAAAVGGFGLAMRSAIDMNSTLETSTLQFATLMGDADLAAEHVAGLFKFAEKTPFETGPIIAASLKLQTFGGEALNTMENLTLLGDASAAVNAPIDELGFWVGRLYSNLQGGQPFGEAAMRLQELAVMSPEARQQMEDLQASGASAEEIFAVFQDSLGGFTGAMEKQAGTWGGLTSTIKDQLSLLTATALKPFFDLLKTGLAGVVAWLNDPAIQQGIKNFAAGFTLLIEKVALFITDQLVPFVQQHAAQFKAVLIAIAGVILLSVIPAVVSIVGAIIAVVWALSSAWESNWLGIRDKVTEAWAVIQPILQAVIEWVSVHVKAAIETLRAWWVDTAWPAIQQAIAVVWPVIQAIFGAIRDFITGILIPVIQALWQKWTQDVWPVIQTVTENVWTVVKAIFEEIGRWINDNIVPWIQFLKQVWAEIVWPALQAAVQSMWDKVGPIWEAIRKWAAETIPPIINALKPIFEGVMNGIRAAIQPVKDLWDGFVGAVQGFWEWIKSKVFNFEIHLPDLPDWAVPGSPLPIHTAWLDFDRDLKAIRRNMTQGIDGGMGTPAAATKTVDNSTRSTIYGGQHIYIEQGDARDPLKTLWRDGL